MMQDCASSNKIKENKYKILRMSLLLGADENKDETINNFEDAAREIDAMNDEIYLKDLEGKFYETTNLEDEEKKLTKLVDYIGGRVEQRISLLTDFSNVTGFDLQNLPPIKYYDKLDDYKDRLKYIQEYLENTNRLNELNEEVEIANKELEKAYKNKASAEEFNQRNEDIILNKFEHITKTLDYFNDINEANIEEYLTQVISTAEESKKSLDIFTKSFNTLTNSGISNEEEEEYHSYVINAQDAYYVNKEKEYLIRLYQYLIKKETEYSSILMKRDCINNLLYERLNLRKELNINDNDLLNGIYELLERQYEDIKNQGENIENIDKLNEMIQYKKEQINELELDNQKVEILALLREFGIIDTYTDISTNTAIDNTEITDEENITSPMDTEINSYEETNLQNGNITENIEEIQKENEEIFNNQVDSSVTDTEEIEEKKEEVLQEENYAENQVVNVENSTNIDLDLVHSKANKVMQRVGEMLGIKPKEEIVSITNTENKSEPEANNKELNKELPQNPLFDQNNDVTNTENSIQTQEEPVDNNFWFPSDMPDALNELPDLEINATDTKNNNNFFNNNNMPDLNFPDLKLDFNNNDTEE